MSEGTEGQEHGPGGFAPIVEGDWKVNVHSNQGLPMKLGFRRYHKHSGEWYYVMYDGDSKLRCSKCKESVPEEMEGYINLARWAVNDN